MKPILLLVPRLILAASVVTAVAAPLPGADDAKPTREAFLGEVLDAKPTPVTPKFDDYTPGSYHVEKEDLLKGLIDESKKRKITLRAATILGPLPGDPLWTSYVVVFLQEGEKVRVNSLVMPHARITGKASGMVTEERYRKWLDGVLATGTLEREAGKAPSNEAKKEIPSPFASDVLLVTWSADGKTREVFHGKVGGDKNVEKLFEQYNGVLKELKKTYPRRASRRVVVQAKGQSKRPNQALQQTGPASRLFEVLRLARLAGRPGC